jgi:benzylsuccinate CoA-transferase BbsF subunit
MDTKLPFSGVKVLEWATALTGPWSTRCLADYGAEVIKVESINAADTGRLTLPYKDNIPGHDRAPRFSIANTGKKSLTLDIKKPRGKEIFLELIAWADILLQNKRPGALKELSLGYEELRKVKKDIILVDISIMGQDGPLVGKVGGWGNNSMAQSGQFYYYRFPENEPNVAGFNATTDAVAPLYIAMASIAALDYKRKTGKGQHIDICQMEPIVHFLGPAILDYTVNGRIPSPVGNRSLYSAPHNAFRCHGDDKWCVIVVSTDDEWKRFCNVVGNPEWTKSSHFATFSRRKENEDELEELISTWTINHTPREVMTMMQEAGVPAGIVQNAEDIVEYDPQVKAREFFPRRSHPVIGEFMHERWPFILSETPGEIRSFPCLGEHNYYVCTDILGMKPEEFVELINSGVMT